MRAWVDLEVLLVFLGGVLEILGVIVEALGVVLEVLGADWFISSFRKKSKFQILGFETPNLPGTKPNRCVSISDRVCSVLVSVARRGAQILHFLCFLEIAYKPVRSL